MKSKKEKLLKKTYARFKKAIHESDHTLIDGLVSDKFMAYGTGSEEIAKSREELKNYLKIEKQYLNEYSAEYKEKPVFEKINSSETSAVIVEEIESKINFKNDVFFFITRNTTVLEFTHNKWSVIHFHISRIDKGSGVDDPLHVKELERKNKELQKLVDEKTSDLILKNKDLEIESALERVRTVSMSMKKQEELLDICEALFKELLKLGFTELRNVMINIFNDEKETFLNYDFSDILGKSITPLFYNIHPIIKKQIRQVRKSKDAYTETVFSIKDLADWKKFRKSRGEKDDPRLKKAKALHYYFYSVGTAAIGISTFSPISNEKKQILKRFRNVFDFAYRRYMDVTEAEAQAREAKIETALERVRSRTMAMQKSEELSETTFLLFQQFMDLGEALDQITIGIINKEEKVIEFWTTMEGNKVDQMIKFPIKETNLMLKLHEAWKMQKKSLAIEIKGQELHDYIDYRIRLTGVKTKKDHTYDHRYIQAAFFSKGMITISTNEPRSQETIQLLERFAGVFDLTYTRFLDLKLAEEQTKEAKIELALERVRARSMAMHHSNELVDASVVLFNELKSLGIETIRTGVGIIDEPNKTLEVWSSQIIEKKRNKILGAVPFKSHPFFEACFKSWKKKDPYFFYELSGNEVKKYYKVMSSILSYPQKKEFNPKECFYTFFFTEGSLNVVSKTNLSDEECSLMIRFAKAFGMIYKRFLDLQKAEAQAREAQVQLALERVRAKAMAMQKSDELLEVSLELYNQFKQLDHAVGGLSINIVNENERVFEVSFGKFYQAFKLSIDEETVMSKAYKAFKSGEKSMEISLSLKDLLKFNKIRNKAIGSDIFPLKYKTRAQLILYIAFFSKGMLIVGMNEHRPKETIEILQRFASVFDMTYTRFLDLKKAEAQAREAQIEVALERVRSKTMAMHNSEEVGETVVSMFDELTKLGIKPYRCGIGIFQEKKQLEAWSARTNTKGKTAIVIGKMDMTTHPLLQGAYEGWKEGKIYFDYELTGRDVLKYFKVINKLPEYPAKYDISKLPKRIFHHDFYFKEGTLFAFTLEPLSDEAKNIFNRFALLFGQTYRRYLDLKKAEAQAREAQIEAALERVRSRSMGMQKSEELKEVIQIVYEQFVHLKINTEHAGFIMDYKNRDDFDNWIADPRRIPFQVVIPYFDTLIYNRFNEAKKKGENFFTLVLSFKEKNNFYKKLFKFVPGLTEEVRKFYFSCPGLAFSAVLLDNVALYIENFSGTPFTDEENSILMRFGKVFQQTYTRFLDLQKAETQAREAKIETSLERVRARTMAMQKSNELDETVNVLQEQLEYLNISAHSSFIGVVDNLETLNNAEMIGHITNIQYIKENPSLSIIDQIEKVEKISKPSDPRDVTFEFYGAGEDQIPSWIKNGTNLKQLLKGLKNKKKSIVLNTSQGEFDYLAYFSNGFIGVTSSLESSSEILDLLERFAGVFDLTYTRFLDLKKAETQAREAQVEAALERTRTQSMVMQHSRELDDTLRVFHEQVLLLGIQSEFSFLWLPDEENDRHIFWVTWLEKINGTNVFKSKAINYPLDRNEPATAQCMIDWKSDEAVHSYNIPPAGVKNYFAAWSELFEGAEQFQPKNYKKGLYYAEAFMKYGCFGVMIRNELLADEKKILLRFAIEFERTYTRFLDLQKAEEQAREAQIEAALERVRGKAMAMHNSDDLTEAAGQVFEELNNLGIKPIRSGFVLLSKESRKARLYPATSFDNKNTVSFTGEFEFTGHPVYEKQYQIWRKKENYFPVLEGDLLKSYYKILAKGLSVPYENFPTDKKQYGTFLPFSEGFIFTWSDEPYSEIEISILDRFKNILDLTIRRYIDLKKAETQAREAQIETSLERVRSKAMAMQKSDDLAVTVTAIFEELDKLDIGMLRCGIGILSKAHRNVNVWATAISEGKKILQISGDESMDSHPLLRGAYEAWMHQKDFSYILKGEDLKDYYKIQEDSNFKIPEWQSMKNKSVGYEQYYYVATFQSGGLFVIRENEFPEDEKIIIKRFADVINFTYTRFNDLKQAEAQAREAKIEAALERVRSRTLAMQNSDELAETAAIVFKQLINLGIEPNRLFIGIIHDERGQIEAWATDEDGTRVSTEFMININANASVMKMYEGWAEKKSSVIIDMQGKELEEYLHYIGDVLHVPFKGGLSQKRRVQIIAYFSNGFIGMASPDPQPEETVILLERFAAVFNLTFTRFNDLQIAEKHAKQAKLDLIKLQTEKKRAEEALTELRATQAQLIQSEKMASLGELTAGIAHEIQNPLNFVNNFSEVNTELIDELNMEIEKGNFEDAAAIAKDIKENEEKIKHHGKRAEGIVKGMLQHSRSSSGVKESVNINALADEYLRLAYHGLRAKDKSFNAKMETDFDESIGEINIVPQEIGRVILNLITNAFYAVSEKKKEEIIGYEPKVIVSTKKADDKVYIYIRDNGNGIPQKVMDKIFQPFFTTKPTGQGTGLGLSMSYDIVKSHGGEIEAEVKENEGTTFNFYLPAK